MLIFLLLFIYLIPYIVCTFFMLSKGHKIYPQNEWKKKTQKLNINAVKILFYHHSIYSIFLIKNNDYAALFNYKWHGRNI